MNGVQRPIRAQESSFCGLEVKLPCQNKKRSETLVGANKRIQGIYKRWEADCN